MSEKRWTRRHWFREICGWTAYPMSMFESKRPHLDDGKRGPRTLSMFRVVLAFFAWTFVQNWPEEWTSGSVAALAIIVFALPLEDLFRKIPVSEALEAIEAFFGSIVAKAADRVSRVRTPPSYDRDERP